MSGANIKISDNKENVDSRRLSISGSAEAVRTAQQLITAKYDIRVCVGDAYTVLLLRMLYSFFIFSHIPIFALAISPWKQAQ